MNLIKKQDGVASLVAVTLSAFLIMVITLAIASLMTGELRQATDSASNIKAYYAASSGAEQAIMDIKTEIAKGDKLTLMNQGCDNDLAGARVGTIDGLVCREIRAYATDLESVMDTDQATQFDLSYAASEFNYGIQRMELNWDSSDWANTDDTGSFVLDPSTVFNTRAGDWNAPRVPPVMELTVTNYFPEQPSTVDASRSGTVLVVPQWECAGCSAAETFPTVLNAAAAAAASKSPIVKANCTQRDMRCRVVLDQIAPLGYKTIVRLSSRYGSARFRMKLVDQLGVDVAVPLKNAQIDVTANVGGAHQRIRMEVPIRSGAYPFQVVYADTQLCKDFDLITYLDGTQEARINPIGGCPLSN